MKKWLIAILILTNTAWGNDSVGLGLTGIQEQGNTRLSLSIGDTHYFNQHMDQYGMYRYGYGSFKMNFGNGFGIDGHSYGGVSFIQLNDDKEGIYPNVGFDFANAWVRLDTNTNSFYGLAPCLAVGPQFGSKTTRVLLQAKAGIYVGSIQTNNYLPGFRWAHGASAYLNSTHFSLNFDMMYFNENSYQALDLFYNRSKDFRIGIHAENIRNSEQLSFLIKSDLIP